MGLLCVFLGYQLVYQLIFNYLCVFDKIVNAHAAIGLDRQNSYTPGSTIAIDCAVQGYPAPNVTWTKNNVPLSSNDRVQITSKLTKIIKIGVEYAFIPLHSLQLSRIAWSSTM